MRTRWKFIAWTVMGFGVVLLEHLWLSSNPPSLQDGRWSGSSTQVKIADGMLQPASVENVAAAVWTGPQAQEKGDGWCFEVFAPPSLWRLHESGSWSLTPPEKDKGDFDPGESSESGFGIEILAIVLRPFPVQLVGFGQTREGEPFGIFENASDGDTLVARRGSALGGMAHVVEEVRVVRTLLGDSEAGRCPVLVAEAIVHNVVTGDLMALNSGERKFVGDPWIRYRATSSGEAGIAGPLASFFMASARYRIAAIRPEDGSVEVIREPPDGGASETRRFQVPVVQALQNSAVAMVQASPPGIWPDAPAPGAVGQSAVK